MSRKTRNAVVIAAALVLALVVPALAKSAFLSAFRQTYGSVIPAGSALDRARCLTCHQPKPGSTSADTKKRNPYGEDLKKAGVAANPAKAFKAVEQLDSDKDGVKNLDEIKKGTLPGDPKSK